MVHTIRVTFVEAVITILAFIMHEDKIAIPSKNQSYVLHWYHTYILHPGMDITEAMIRQHLYWTGIRNSIQREVTNCETCPCTKQPNKKYSKLPAKLADKNTMVVLGNNRFSLPLYLLCLLQKYA